MIIMNDFVKWWIVQYLKMYKVGGSKNIQKILILLENNDNICDLAVKECKLKKHDVIDNQPEVF